MTPGSAAGAPTQEESLDDSGSSAAGRAKLVSSMESQVNGPFAIDWNMEQTLSLLTSVFP